MDRRFSFSCWAKRYSNSSRSSVLRSGSELESDELSSSEEFDSCDICDDLSEPIMSLNWWIWIGFLVVNWEERGGKWEGNWIKWDVCWDGAGINWEKSLSFDAVLR